MTGGFSCCRGSWELIYRKEGNDEIAIVIELFKRQNYFLYSMLDISTHIMRGISCLQTCLFIATLCCISAANTGK